MTNHESTRRAFLQATLAASLGAVAGHAQARPAAASGDAYTVLFLGDVHFDRLSHHDMSWLSREKPNDVRQVQNYSRLTADVWPRTLARIREHIATGAAGGPRAAVGSGVATGSGAAAVGPGGRPASSPVAPVAFVAQIGDLVEGLCGTQALADVQAQEALASIRDARLGAPFLFCKGNHDITGPGARDIFDKVLLPFVQAQAGAIGPTARTFDAEGASLAVSHGPDWFLFLDAYDLPRATPWLERVLAKRDARHVFLLVHPPVVPYGARSTWIVYPKTADRDQRQRLLTLLGEHRVFALTGHIHKYAAMTRQTDRGPFVQLALSSVISQPSPAGAARAQLTGIPDYTPDQVRVEPEFSPATIEERRSTIALEAPQVRAFEYGDVPGYAAITVDGANVRVDLHAGLTTRPWRTLDLVALRDRSPA